MVQMPGYCQFEPTPEAGVYRCRWCGFTVVSPRYGAEQIHRYCDALASLVTPHVSASESVSQGLGDTVHRLVRPLARLLGLEHCGGCQKRRAWLNRHFPFRNHPTEMLPTDVSQAAAPW